jgi:RimJ/RimL family protein N-acetyltransferase
MGFALYYIGAMLSGQPEARFEAYARAYAGCGVHTSTDYRRSYARMYETMACATHATETKYREHWLERPGDIVGRTVRLEPLDAKRHLNDLFGITNGDASAEKRAYDPNEVWGFCDIGPFSSPQEMGDSSLFQNEAENEATFAIVEQITDKMLGIVCLTNDNPKNLTISLEVPILKPSSEGTVEPLEACFLLMDRLYALGYRRIQLSIDSMDTYAKKYCGRLGFTQEGMIPKDRIVKESNRDSLIYGMLNSDWSKGARAFLFKKLHGDKAMKQDAQNNKKEAELEQQADYLAKQKKEASTEIKK